MKTWRVSMTYRVKSAHKVKLTDKQLLQWMVPILLVMGIYLGTWTAAEPPTATEVIYRVSRDTFHAQLYPLCVNRSRTSRDYTSNSAPTTGGIMPWPSARFSSSCGASKCATTSAMPSRFTTRPNWYRTLSTTLHSSTCSWWRYSKCL